jgi:tetratricopeptide (TPR) repeat protein
MNRLLSSTHSIFSRGAWPALVLLLSSFVISGQEVTDGAKFNDLSKRAAAALSSNPAEAAILYRQTVELRPQWAEGWFYLGASLYQTARYPESRSALQKAAGLDPEHGAVWAFLGLCEFEMKEYPQALADIRKGENFGLPDDLAFVSTVRNRAALISIRASDFMAAVEQLRPLAAAGDHSQETIEALGVSVLGIPKAASEVAPEQKALIQLAGQAAWNLYNANRDKSNRTSEELVRTYSHTAGVHYLRGLCLVDTDAEGAVAEFRNELQISPSYVPARLQIGILQLNAEDPGSALRTASEALKLEPDNALAHELAGRAQLDLGQPDKAVLHLEAAVRLTPQNPQMHYHLADAYGRVGRSEDASKQRAEFVRLKAAHRAQ